MPKPMRVTQEIRDRVISEFVRSLSGTRLMDGKVSFVKDFAFREGEKATVEFTHKAYSKMMALVDQFNTEVAWHGFVDRVSQDHFVIDDIVVYPQTVTGATVNTDQEAYDKWLMTISGDDFNRMKFQGHSHVNMSVSPSAVDLQHQGSVISQLGQEGFYIFLIVNKSRKCMVKVYDAENNTLFEEEDINVIVPEEDLELSKFIAEAKEVAPSAPFTRSLADKVSVTKTKTVPRKKQKQQELFYFNMDEDIDDYDEYIFGSNDPYSKYR